MDLFEALDRSTAGFARTLSQVRDDQWTAPTPNPGWSVRDLVNHVVGGNRRYIVLLTGAPTVDVEALRDLDHLSSDPTRAFCETAAAVAVAFQAPGAMTQIVHHRLGDRTGEELLVMRVIEHALHGWDLAHAIGDDDDLDSDVAETVLAAFAADPRMLSRTSFAPRTPPADADPQRRLLSLTGRAG
jgi:uncharacterized protein (TIGR03086 family)